jgi:hypothetical protein
MLLESTREAAEARNRKIDPIGSIWRGGGEMGPGSQGSLAEHRGCSGSPPIGSGAGSPVRDDGAGMTGRPR